MLHHLPAKVHAHSHAATPRSDTCIYGCITFRAHTLQVTHLLLAHPTAGNPGGTPAPLKHQVARVYLQSLARRELEECCFVGSKQLFFQVHFHYYLTSPLCKLKQVLASSLIDGKQTFSNSNSQCSLSPLCLLNLYQSLQMKRGKKYIFLQILLNTKLH